MEPVLCQSHCVRDKGPTACKHDNEGVEKEVGEPPNPKRGGALSLVKRLSPCLWKVFAGPIQTSPGPADTERAARLQGHPR